MSAVATNLHTLSFVYARAIRIGDPWCKRNAADEANRLSAKRRIHDAFLRLAAEEGHDIEGSPYRPKRNP